MLDLKGMKLKKRSCLCHVYLINMGRKLKVRANIAVLQQGAALWKPVVLQLAIAPRAAQIMAAVGSETKTPFLTPGMNLFGGGILVFRPPFI